MQGGEWSRTGHGKEWVEPMREKLGATCSQESVGVHYPMPAASLCVGAFVGYKYQGTTAVGCVVRIGDGQTWIARPGQSVYFMAPDKKITRDHQMSDAGIFVCTCAESRG